VTAPVVLLLGVAPLCVWLSAFNTRQDTKKTRHDKTTEDKPTEDKTRQHTQDKPTQYNTTQHNTIQYTRQHNTKEQSEWLLHCNDVYYNETQDKRISDKSKTSKIQGKTR
jgi:hypothetical protein